MDETGLDHGVEHRHPGVPVEPGGEGQERGVVGFLEEEPAAGPEGGDEAGDDVVPLGDVGQHRPGVDQVERTVR